MDIQIVVVLSIVAIISVTLIAGVISGKWPQITQVGMPTLVVLGAMLNQQYETDEVQDDVKVSQAKVLDRIEVLEVKLNKLAHILDLYTANVGRTQEN